MSWKKLNRKTIYDTKFLKVYEDRVELPNGNVHDSYSVFKLPNIIVVVATDEDENIITVNEYKYGPDKIMRIFPAGHIDEGEDMIIAAKRELLEETGYGQGEFEMVGVVQEFSTKNLGNAHIVRAKNVRKISSQNLDENEMLEVQLVTKEELKKEIKEHKWEDAKCLAAITLTNLLSS